MPLNSVADFKARLSKTFSTSVKYTYSNAGESSHALRPTRPTHVSLKYLEKVCVKIFHNGFYI